MKARKWCWKSWGWANTARRWKTKFRDPVAFENKRVAGAIRTDLILSAEIMAITLAALDLDVWCPRGLALALVAVVVTVAVYGARWR